MDARYCPHSTVSLPTPIVRTSGEWGSVVGNKTEQSKTSQGTRIQSSTSKLAMNKILATSGLMFTYKVDYHLHILYIHFRLLNNLICDFLFSFRNTQINNTYHIPLTEHHRKSSWALLRTILPLPSFWNFDLNVLEQWNLFYNLLQS